METNTNQSTEVKKRHPLFKWIFVGGIMIVANLFLNYTIAAFYPAPKYEVFCPQKQVNEALLTEDSCVATGGQWNEQLYTYPYAPSEAVPTPVRVQEKIQGYCNVNFTCQKNYDEANNVYNRNVFIMLVALGTALLVGSIFVTAIEAVALGFSFAGILSLIIGTTRYWGSMDDRMRVVVLGLALVALIWVGIKKFKN